MSDNPYPEEVLGEDEDDGTMPNNVAALADAVVGHRIARVEPNVQVKDRYGWTENATVITLDNGHRVSLADGGDCCAFTELRDFILHADRIDHVITGVGTSGGYTTWHIFADAGDVLEMSVGWSCGNPFYYGYGFSINVTETDGES